MTNLTFLSNLYGYVFAQIDFHEAFPAGIIYHPSQDDDAVFTDYLITSLDTALNKYPNAVIMLVGDFNRFNYRVISNHFNLRQIVKNPTRGTPILDLIFTNLFHHYNIPQILPGIGLSDHNSLLIRPFWRIHNGKVYTIYKECKAKHEVLFWKVVNIYRLVIPWIIKDLDRKLVSLAMFT